MEGTVFLSINRRSKDELLSEVKRLHEEGFKIIGTEGTANYYTEHGIPCERVFKVSEGRPNIVDLIKNGDVQLIVNTPEGKMSKDDAFTIRQAAVRYHIPIMTTIQAAKAVIGGLLAVKASNGISVLSIQEYHKEVT